MRERVHTGLTARVAPAYKPTTMKRIWTTSLAVSLLVLPACKGGASADAVKLIPDEAEFIVGLNPKTITGSDLYKEFSSEFEKEDDFKEAMKAFEDCGLKPTEFDAVVIGASQTEDFVAVIVGDGIGEDDNASCVIKNIQKMSGEEEAAEVSKEDGKKVIQFTDGRAYLVNKNMMALSTTAWEDKVGELIDGKGTPAIENGKKDLYGKVDAKAAVWFIADVPAELAGMAAMAAPEATAVKTVAGSVDLSKGVALDFIAGFGDEAKAKATADKIQEMFDGLKGQAPPELAGVVESVKIEASGPDVKVGVSASMDDIKAGKDKMPL
ncbi:hypothetical protein ENSA7_77280 [Enhygromyxa salina]|uniref:Uncharacterized protein n=2 Tax=Enhygromyxa salina TaxID=215803 RepID=A0A2S9XPX4_9BACT|nr:hypothetical protein ENSA7_77280 [Enhygromyxa salina]